LGVISEHELYTRKEVKLRMGLKDAALREAQAKGLRAAKIGRNKFYLGRDIIAYVQQQAEDQDLNATSDA
jgi:hypothetical protein